MKSYSICLSLSDFISLSITLLGPSILLQMARFHSFLCLSNITLYTHTHTHTHTPHISDSPSPKNWYFQIVLEKTFRAHWTARRSNKSILKEINPEYLFEGFMLKLNFQYLDYLMWRAHSLEKILMLGKIEGKRGKGWQRMRWLDSITDSMDMNLSTFWKILKDRTPVYCSSWGHKELDTT